MNNNSNNLENALAVMVHDALKEVFENYLKNQNEAASDTDNAVELLTIKECMQLSKNLTYYTISKWIKQNRVVYIRAGEGIRGKFLINKASFIAACANNPV